MAIIPKDDVNISSFDAFYDQMNGNGVDVDGWYGCQCWDGAAVLWYKLGYTLFTGPQGYAYECWTVSKDANTHPPTITQITDKKDIKRGDVVVFNWTLNGYAGHIAYAFEDYKDGSMRFFGQNQEGGSPATGWPFTVDEIGTATILGAFRYDKWQGPPPPPPTPPKLKTRGRSYPWPVALSAWGFNRKKF